MVDGHHFAVDDHFRNRCIAVWILKAPPLRRWNRKAVLDCCRVIDILHEEKRDGTAMIISSHILNDLEDIADRLGVELGVAFDVDAVLGGELVENDPGGAGDGNGLRPLSRVRRAPTAWRPTTPWRVARPARPR